jgi:Phage Mu protein F like protein
MATKEEDRKRLKVLLAASALLIRIRIERFIERAQSPEVIAEIVTALESGNQSAAMSIVVAQTEILKPAVLEAFIDAGNAAAEEAAAGSLGAAGQAAAGGMGGGLPPFMNEAGDFMARVGIVFDPTNPRASAAIRDETQLFLKDMTDQQIAATRKALADAFDKGMGPRATANVIRDSIGLTEYQMGIVERYEDVLRAGSKRALDYKLRQASADAAVSRAASGSGNPLSEARIARMVDAYRKNFVRLRAETIARTESTRVTSMAREETYRQIAAKLGIGDNRLIRIWNPTEDDRTRDWHWSMDGQEAALGSSFVDGLGNSLRFPGDPKAPAQTTVNCRCSLTFRVAE